MTQILFSYIPHIPGTLHFISIFSVSFVSGDLYCSVFHFTDSFLYTFYSALEPILWLFCSHCIFQFWNFSFISSDSLLRVSSFFIYFKQVCNLLVKHFYHDCFKSSSDDFNISVISVLASVDCLLFFKIEFEIFLVDGVFHQCQVVFSWKLDIFMLHSGALDLPYTLRLSRLFLSHSGRGGEGTSPFLPGRGRDSGTPLGLLRHSRAPPCYCWEWMRVLAPHVFPLTPQAAGEVCSWYPSRVQGGLGSPQPLLAWGSAERGHSFSVVSWSTVTII